MLITIQIMFISIHITTRYLPLKKKKVIRKYFLVADFFKKEKENRNISSRIYFKAALVLILNYQEWLIGVL